MTNSKLSDIIFQIVIALLSEDWGKMEAKMKMEMKMEMEMKMGNDEGNNWRINLARKRLQHV